MPRALGPDPCAAGQRRVEGGHAPVVAVARRLGRRGQRGAEHDGVGAAHDGLGHVASRPHPPVGDDVDVYAGFVQVLSPGGPGVGDGRGLGYADAEDSPGRAGMARARPRRARRRRRYASGAGPPGRRRNRRRSTGISNSRMKRLRLRGSTVLDTCSAETTVPWMTNRSSSASMRALAYWAVRCGVSDAHATTPAALISRIRAVISSACMGSA